MVLTKISMLIALAFVLPRCQPPPAASCVVDEASRDATLLDFRSRLLQAVRTKNAELLRPLVDPMITFEVGERGWNEFVETTRLADPKSEIWVTIERNLSLGGRLLEPDAFCAPYFTCPTWPGDDDDIVKVVVNREVPIRQRPSMGAPTLGDASCKVFTAPGGTAWPETPAGWSAVLLMDRRWGFVESSHVVVAETSLHLAKREGTWRLVAILSPE